MFLLCLAACRTFIVDSNPRGADIVIDGAVSGWKTPHKFEATGFTTGHHTISASMPGYRTVTPEHGLEVSVSATKIVLAVLLPLPCLIIGLGTGFKAARVPNMFFQLEPTAATSEATAKS
jgi:hypothetical protein